MIPTYVSGERSIQIATEFGASLRLRRERAREGSLAHSAPRTSFAPRRISPRPRPACARPAARTGDERIHADTRGACRSIRRAVAGVRQAVISGSREIGVVRIVHDPAEQRLEMPGHTGDRFAVEQIGVVDQFAEQPARFLGNFEAQVVWRNSGSKSTSSTSSPASCASSSG